VDPRRIRELTDSMMHAPRLVPIAKRFELDDTILVISHAEIWKWRIVLRGTRASRGAPMPLTVPVVPDVNEGASGVLWVEHYDPRTGRHEAHRWLTEWSVHDDIGTDYRLVSGGGGGTGGEWWSDLHVQFEPSPPAGASRLTFRGPELVACTIELTDDPTI
jgi:hypothetical protein